MLHHGQIVIHKDSAGLLYQPASVTVNGNRAWSDG